MHTGTSLHPLSSLTVPPHDLALFVGQLFQTPHQHRHLTTRASPPAPPLPQSTYEDVARDTNRGHTVAAVGECFQLAKDAGFKVGVMVWCGGWCVLSYVARCAVLGWAGLGCVLCGVCLAAVTFRHLPALHAKQSSPKAVVAPRPAPVLSPGFPPSPVHAPAATCHCHL
jgi:hypothetical protein